MTQREQILEYINQFGSVTPIQAFADLGITKLATRISEMKRDGVRIHTESVKVKNRFGKNVTFAVYSLEEEK